jgi:hypothetical protein
MPALTDCTEAFENILSGSFGPDLSLRVTRGYRLMRCAEGRSERFRGCGRIHGNKLCRCAEGRSEPILLKFSGATNVSFCNAGLTSVMRAWFAC